MNDHDQASQLNNSAPYVGMNTGQQRAGTPLSLAELDQLFKLSLDILCIAGADGYFKRVNPAFTRTLGWSEEELLSRPYMSFVHPDDIDSTRRVVEREVGAGEKVMRFENRYLHKDGSWRQLEWTSVPQPDGLMYATARDITERERAKEAAHQEAARHAAMIANITDVIAVIGIDGIIKYESFNISKCFGWQPQDLVGTDWWVTVHPDDIERLRCEFAVLLGEDKSCRRVEYKVRCKDGSYKPIALAATNLANDPLINGVLMNYHDITERKNVEAKLRDAEWKFKALFEKGPIGVAYHKMIYDASGKPIDYLFLDANDAYRELTGVDPRGKTVTQAFPGIEKDPFDYIGTFGRVAREGKEIRFESHLQFNDQWYDVVGYQYKPDHFVAAFNNITERKRAEVEREKLQTQLIQSQKMESVGRLAGGVAHDFNNLLAGIMGYVELSGDQLPPEHPARRYLEEIMKDAKRSADLVRQLLAFARKQIIAPRVLDLNDAIVAALKLIQRLIGEDINLRWAPGAGLWPVKADPSQIDQIMANLCVNARDAIGGVGSLSIATRNISVDQAYCEGSADATPGEYVLISVSDTGKGMDKEVLDHIFEPFFTTKEVGQGTGLGLATVHGIVSQNKGFITVYSEPGKGATFKIHLPRYVGHDDAVPAAETLTKSAGGKETILLVEDEKSVLVTTCAFLESFGYTVLVAEAPEQALKLIAETSGEVHLLVTDVIMPGMSGQDLSLRLAKRYPAIKTIFISGFTADIIAERGILPEHCHFLSKPFSRQHLTSKVREVLDGQQAK